MACYSAFQTLRRPSGNIYLLPALLVMVLSILFFHANITTIFGHKYWYKYVYRNQQQNYM